MNQIIDSVPKHQNTIIKKVYNIGTKKVVSIDESIAKKFDISEENNTFLEQEITEDGKGILLRKVNIKIE